jgi:hypothetical protein
MDLFGRLGILSGNYIFKSSVDQYYAEQKQEPSVEESMVDSAVETAGKEAMSQQRDTNV